MHMDVLRLQLTCWPRLLPLSPVVHAQLVEVARLLHYIFCLFHCVHVYQCSSEQFSTPSSMAPPDMSRHTLQMDGPGTTSLSSW
jgi:hypothetical protein